MLGLSDTNLDERRSFKRVRLSEPVQFEINLQGFKGCLASDISEGGLRITVSEFIPLHAELMLRIQMPQARMIEGTGRVVWVEKVPFNDRYRVGLEFINPETTVALRQTVHHFIELSKV